VSKLYLNHTLVNNISTNSVATFENYFVSAAIGCYYFSSDLSTKSCQILGNLCVLNHFSPKTAPCDIFNKLAQGSRATIVNSLNGWATTMPFLLYSSTATTILSQTNIQMKVSLSIYPEAIYMS